jgi:hypothetical protein
MNKEDDYDVRYAHCLFCYYTDDSFHLESIHELYDICYYDHVKNKCIYGDYINVCYGCLDYHITRKAYGLWKHTLQFDSSTECIVCKEVKLLTVYVPFCNKHIEKDYSVSDNST